MLGIENRMLRIELPSKQIRGRPKEFKFMDVMKDMQVVGVTVESR